jgi:hypothetical protein
MKRFPLPLALLLLVAALPAAQDDPKEVENPRYRSWSRFKVGTSSKSRLRHSSNGSGYDVESKASLLELNAERAVLRLEERENSTGVWKEGEPMKETLPARVSEAELRRTSFGIARQVKPKEGEAELEIAGRRVKCRTEEYQDSPGPESGERFMLWRSDAIPGGSQDGS